MPESTSALDGVISGVKGLFSQKDGPASNDFLRNIGGALTNPSVLTATALAAGGAGLLGNMGSSRIGERRGESKEERRRRIMRDTMLAAGLGGGAAASIGVGSHVWNNAKAKAPFFKGLKPIQRLATAGASVGTQKAFIDRGTLRWGGETAMDVARRNVAQMTGVPLEKLHGGGVNAYRQAIIKKLKRKNSYFDHGRKDNLFNRIFRGRAFTPDQEATALLRQAGLQNTNSPGWLRAQNPELRRRLRGRTGLAITAGAALASPEIYGGAMRALGWGD